MKNKDLIKILLSFPLDHEIRLNADETIFSIESVKTMKYPMTGYIYFNSCPRDMMDLPSKDYEHWYMGKRWINDIDTFSIHDTTNDDEINIKYIKEGHKFKKVME